MIGRAPSRNRPRGAAARSIAALVAAWLVVAGALGLRHEATVEHALDAVTGAIVHGARVVGHVGGAADHVHAGVAAQRADACALVAATHQPAAGAAAAVAARAPAGGARPLEAAPRGAGVARAIWRVAPKTSPPRA